MSDSGNAKTPTVAENGDVTPIDDGSGKKKKLIMILIPLLLLIGGGAGLYFSGMLDGMLGKKAETEKEKTAEGEGEHTAAEGEGEAAPAEEGGHEAAPEGEGEKAAEEKGGEEKGGHGEKKEGGHVAGSTFLKIPDLIVNLASTGQPRYLRLSIQLEMKSEEDVKKVEAVMPRVIDQFQTYLRELRVEDLKGSRGIYRLQMELLSRVNAAASPVEVKDVLFQEILIQ